MPLKCQSVLHQFSPGETIRAIIKNKNNQAMTDRMLNLLMKEYNNMNGTVVPIVGQKKQIPVFVGFLGSGVKDDLHR